MATKTRPWTRAELRRLPDDGNRYELLNGELLVTPQASVPHQGIAARLVVLLSPYVERHGLGTVVGPGGVVFRGNEFQPDVLVAPVSRDALPEKWEQLPPPILVAEVLSGGSRRHDLITKPAVYVGLGIPQYWVIDRFERRALAWSGRERDPAITTTELRWHPRPDLPALVIPLSNILPPQGSQQPSDEED